MNLVTCLPGGGSTSLLAPHATGTWDAESDARSVPAMRMWTTPGSTCDVTVLDLGDDENSINPTFVANLTEGIESAVGAERPLVLTATGKYWTTGLDIEWIRNHRSQADALIADVHELLGRVLVAPVPTVAAINGHVFGAGAMLALACDLRVMRDDRGYWCFPEVDLRLAPTAPMTDLVVAKVGRRAAAAALLSGSTLPAAQACDLGFVDHVASAADLVAVAIERAAPMAGKSVGTFAAIKRRIWGSEASGLVDARGSLPTFAG